MQQNWARINLPLIGHLANIQTWALYIMDRQFIWSQRNQNSYNIYDIATQASPFGVSIKEICSWLYIHVWAIMASTGYQSCIHEIEYKIVYLNFYLTVDDRLALNCVISTECWECIGDFNLYLKKKKQNVDELKHVHLWQCEDDTPGLRLIR